MTPTHSRRATGRGDTIRATVGKPHDRDRRVPRRKGELIDDRRDKVPEDDEVPDTPPTEPQPVPVEDPPASPEQQGPYVTG